jgi:hypothetical protein
VLAADVDDPLDQLEHRRVQGRKTRRQGRASAVDGKRVLNEIVGADAEEADIVDESVDAERCSGRLDHHSERQIVPVLDAAIIQLTRGFVEQVPRLLHFVERYDQRKHDADVAVHRGAQERPELRLEKLRLIQAHPDRAPAEEGVRIRRMTANGKLVAPDVERADHHRSSIERLDDVTIRLVLFLFVGHGRASDDQELRPH